jgi:protein TonB
LVDVLQTSAYPRLDDAARAAVRLWRFTPAVQNGQPVESGQILSIHFRLD